MSRRDQLQSETEFQLKHELAFYRFVYPYDQLAVNACDGLLSAHGDKTEQYRDYWAEYGIPQAHATLVYLLTFTKVFGETPKHLSREWVVVNYHKYEKFLSFLE